MNIVRLSLSIDPIKELTDEDLMNCMLKKLHCLIDCDAIRGPLDKILIGYDLDESGQGFIIVDVSSDCIVDPSKFNTVGASLLPDDFIINKSFSVSSIDERIKLSRRSPTQQFRSIIDDYKKYYNQNESRLSSNKSDLMDFTRSFLNDMSGLFNELADDIKSGSNLANLLDLKNVSSDLVNIGKDLSIAYKNSIKSMEGSGGISSSVMSNMKDLYRQFILKVLSDVVMGLESDSPESVELSDKTRVPFSFNI